MIKTAILTISDTRNKTNDESAKAIMQILGERDGRDGDCHASCDCHQTRVLNPGDFAENITTEGISLLDLKIGTQLKIGDKVIIEISKIGKDCPKHCAIYYKTGDCIMPKEGIFAKILKTGTVKVQDKIDLL